MQAIQNLINGQLVPAQSGKTLPNYDPATGTEYSTIPDSDLSDVQLAIGAAEKAFPMWAALPETKRAQHLRRIGELIQNNIEKFAHAESMDNGKPVTLAQSVDIPRAIKNFSFFADTISQFTSESYQSIEPRGMHYTLRQPLGVVGCISPWNLPLS